MKIRNKYEVEDAAVLAGLRVVMVQVMPLDRLLFVLLVLSPSSRAKDQDRDGDVFGVQEGSKIEMLDVAAEEEAAAEPTPPPVAPTPSPDPVTQCENLPKSKSLFSKRFGEAFESYCKDKKNNTERYQSFHETSQRIVGENACAISDAHYASSYEVTTPSPAATKEDRLLFDHVAEVFNSVDQLMDWGPDYSFWSNDFPDVILNESVHSEGSYHGEYYQPFLADKWRKDRATIFFANSCPCTFIRAQAKQGALWTEDYHNKRYGAFDRAKATMEKSGVKVEIDKTRSPPLDHPYIIIGTLGDNWGWLSGNVPNRTIDWGGIEYLMENEGGCTKDELMEFLENPMLKAIVVQQHQEIFHNKIISLPLGHKTQAAEDLFAQIMKWKNKPESYPAKVRLLLINNSCYRHRRALTTALEKQMKMYNSYGLLSSDQFTEAVASSKYVFCPSGLGWDCYRMWEVLLLGSIPIIEHSPGHPSHGWDRTLDDLPVLWVDDFSDVTEELLETSYPKLVAKHKAYKYEKLTQGYWEKRIYKAAEL